MRLLLLFAISQAADVASTIYSKARGSYEVNLVAKTVTEHGGIISLILLKIALVVFATFIVVRMTRLGGKYFDLAQGVVTGLTIVTLGVAAWNMVSWMNL